VLDASGREVALLAEGMREAGEHAERWLARGQDGRELPSGVYFARLEVKGRVFSRKLTLLR
jgi:hypothetical protein